jgi:hypothetical protein
MEWISQNTSTGDNFIVLTGINDWFINNISEWFPALTSRKSVATIQGIEWLPRDNIYHRRYIDLQECTNVDAYCLSIWSDEYNVSYSYIYLHKPIVGKTIVAPPISYSLNLYDQYQLAYDNSRVSIYYVRNGP